jgi:hypothetical protein
MPSVQPLPDRLEQLRTMLWDAAAIVDPPAA